MDNYPIPLCIKVDGRRLIYNLTCGTDVQVHLDICKTANHAFYVFFLMGV